MKLFKCSILSLFIICSFLFANQIFAEVNNSLISKDSEPIATVNIQNAKIISVAGNNFKISFDITNRNGAQSGVKYGISLMGSGDNGQFLADENIYPDILSLKEYSSTHKEILYSAPSNITGDYSLYLSVKNSSGFPLGISYVGKASLTSSVKGVSIDSDSCYLSILDEVGNKKYTLTQGVDIDKTENLVLSCNAINSSSATVSVIPNYETTYRSAYGDIVTNIGGSLNPIIFSPSESKNISLTLPKAEKPQAYNVKVSLKSENNLSNYVSVHYVIAGTSGTIQNISLNKISYKKGDIANLSFLSSGQANNFIGNRSNLKSSDDGIITAQILNSEGQTCSEIITTVGSDKNITGSKSELSIPIIRDCTNAVASVSLKDSKGNTLDQKTFSLKEDESSMKTLWFYYIIILIALILILILFYFKKKKNSNTVNNIPTKVFSILFVLIIFGSFLPNVAKADTYVVGDKNGRNATFVINGIESSFEKNTVIGINGTVTITACDNFADNVKVSVTYHDQSYTLLDTSGKAKINGGGLAIFSSYEQIKTSSESKEGDYLLINLSFGGEIKTIYKYFNVGKVDHAGRCPNISYQNNPDYPCGYGVPIETKSLEKTWEWKCRGDIEPDAECKADKIAINGMCNNSYGYICTYGQAIYSIEKNGYFCKGLYGGVDSPICRSNSDQNVVCGQDFGTCRDSYTYNGSYFDSTQFGWWCQSPVVNGGSSSIFCRASISGAPYTVGNLTPSCIIPDEGNSCNLDVGWKFKSNVDATFDICTSDKCNSVITNGVISGTYSLGNRSYGKNEVISMKNLKGETIYTTEFSPSCENNSVWSIAKNRCVKNGGWSNYTSWSSCNVSCTSLDIGKDVEGKRYRNRSCNNPLPSISGLSCPGSDTEEESCKAQCNAGFPTTPIISGPNEVYAGVEYSFDVISNSNIENKDIRYGIDWSYSSNKDLKDYNSTPLSYLKFITANFLYNNTMPDSSSDYYKNYFGNLNVYNYDKETYKVNDIEIKNWVPAPQGNTIKFTQEKQKISHKWPDEGIYTFRVIAQNYDDNFSNWSPKTVVVKPNTTVKLTANPSTTSDDSILTWTSTSAKQCSIKNITDNKEIAKNLNPNSKDNGGTGIKVRIIKDTKYSITCNPINIPGLTDASSEVTVFYRKAEYKPEDKPKPQIPIEEVNFKEI